MVIFTMLTLPHVQWRLTVLTVCLSSDELNRTEYVVLVIYGRFMFMCGFYSFIVLLDDGGLTYSNVWFIIIIP